MSMGEKKRQDQVETACGLAETIHGTPYGEHTKDRGDGQQIDYLVLTADERAKGFKRPLRRAYRHTRCGGVTTMGLALCETYARCPDFYSGTFCCSCGSHFPVGSEGEFVWVKGRHMMGFKPSHRIWEKVNEAILGENAGEVLVTMISGMCSLLVSTGVVADETLARAHLAAVLVSPDSDERPGSLLPQLQAELARLADGKWLQ